MIPETSPSRGDSAWRFTDALSRLSTPAYSHDRSRVDFKLSGPLSTSVLQARASLHNPSTAPKASLSHESCKTGGSDPEWETPHSDMQKSTQSSTEDTSLDSSPPMYQGHQSCNDNSNSVIQQASQKPTLTQGSVQVSPSSQSKTILVPSPTKSHATKATKAAISVSLPPPRPSIRILKRTKINPNAPVHDPPTMNAQSSQMIPASNKLDKEPASKQTQELSEPSSQCESDESDTLINPNPLMRSGAMEFVPLQVGIAGDHKKDYGTSTPPKHENKFASPVHAENMGQNKRLVNRSDSKAVSDRRILLIIRLIQIFPDYAQRVSELGQPQGPHVQTPRMLDTIHVFVDMSNILFGLHESVQDTQGSPRNTKASDLDISFANFSLIIERGRPAAKRVLAGSDHLPATKDAESLGYEVNILNRVRKERSRGGPERASTYGHRWVEQGVDEILHLKMLESIIDSEEPTTMVLASGDAAKAEYSDGFLPVVERALQRGWNVELVSFRKALGSAYKNKDFRAIWGPRFKILLLDEYVHSLYEGYLLS
ncbi:hypothetical protein N7493_009946 [Penicillium malachiteum]|uniref:NYN domain-containing protein n=1 Tax=Penicillium malachiteum TaxID=1324776 RepID=A0AAD6MS09_9EURO|nr:hypothetical protein N7493_009946 [Penicillium malachiteum]